MGEEENLFGTIYFSPYKVILVLKKVSTKPNEYYQFFFHFGARGVDLAYGGVNLASPYGI